LLAKIAVSCAVLVAFCGQGAWACQATSGAPILNENFKTPDPGWGPPDESAAFTTAGLVLKPPINGSAWRWNPNYSADNHDLCVTVVNPSPLPARGDIGDVGVWFWDRDAQNFYTATLSLAGTVSVDRLVNGAWQTVLAPTAADAVKTAAGAENQVEVVLRGNAGTFYVNGAKIGDFRGEPPPNGGAPGVYAESGGTPVAWTFSQVQLF